MVFMPHVGAASDSLIPATVQWLSASGSGETDSKTSPYTHTAYNHTFDTTADFHAIIAYIGTNGRNVSNLGVKVGSTTFTRHLEVSVLNDGSSSNDNHMGIFTSPGSFGSSNNVTFTWDGGTAPTLSLVFASVFAVWGSSETPVWTSGNTYQGSDPYTSTLTSSSDCNAVIAGAVGRNHDVSNNTSAYNAYWSGAITQTYEHSEDAGDVEPTQGIWVDVNGPWARPRCYTAAVANNGTTGTFTCVIDNTGGGGIESKLLVGAGWS